MELPARVRAGLAEYAARVREGLGENLLGLRLFGSWARGTAHAGSDVDVWVLVRVRDEAARRVPYEAAVDALLAHGIDLAPTVMDEAEWRQLSSRGRRIARDIQREGVAL